MKRRKPRVGIEFDRESSFPMGLTLQRESTDEQKQLLSQAELVSRMFEGVVRQGGL